MSRRPNLECQARASNGAAASWESQAARTRTLVWPLLSGCQGRRGQGDPATSTRPLIQNRVRPAASRPRVGAAPFRAARCPRCLSAIEARSWSTVAGRLRSRRWTTLRNTRPTTVSYSTIFIFISRKTWNPPHPTQHNQPLGRSPHTRRAQTGPGQRHAPNLLLITRPGPLFQHPLLCRPLLYALRPSPGKASPTMRPGRLFVHYDKDTIPAAVQPALIPSFSFSRLCPSLPLTLPLPSPSIFPIFEFHIPQSQTPNSKTAGSQAD